MLKFVYILFFLSIFQSPEKEIAVHMIGDSTMSIKEDNKRPETGWGMPFGTFFKDSVSVYNYAVNGRSTKSFLAEDRWRPVLDQVQAGDYVFIQFAHNDEVPSKVGRHTTVEEYKANLTKFVNESREKSAIPILFTAVTRRQFDEQGNVLFTHPNYSEAVIELGKVLDVLVIDMDEKSRALLAQLGDEKSKSLYLQLEPDEHPNYPEGVIDNTHFNEEGAMQMALIAKNELIKVGVPLAMYFKE